MQASLAARFSASIAEQHAFVAWWAANVTPGKIENLAKSPKRKEVAAAQLPISVAEATRETGVSKFQVSRWGKRLADESG
jgi:hypothetical protein